MRRAALALLGLVTGCSGGERDAISIGEVVRCRDPLPPATLPALMPDTHASDFFSTRPLPVLEFHGGPILRNPHIVAVFFGDDPLQKLTEALLQSYGCTSAWRGAVAEYGVGDAIYERTVVLPSFPDIHGQAEFEEWMKQQATTLGLGGDDRTFIFYPPRGADVPADPCGTSLGYHTAVALDADRPAETTVVYAILNQCPTGGWVTSLDVRTHITTHELMEMAVDPLPVSNPAWTGLDQSHIRLRFDFDENADVCNDLQVLSPADYPFAVSAGWSNRRAQLGLDPCTPADRVLALAYPRQTTLDLTNGSAELDVDIYSDDRAAQYVAVPYVVTNGPCVTIETVPPTPTLGDGSTLHLKLTVQSGTVCTGDSPGIESVLVVFLASEDDPTAALVSEVLLTGI